jgi:uncharacterized phiE125 gp8 family phage protein
VINGESLITTPASEPLSLSEVKLSLKVDNSADDTLISSIITAARRYCEFYTRRQFVTATWEIYLNEFPDISEIEIPKPPLQSVGFVKYYDTASTPVLQTWTASGNYEVDIKATPGRLLLIDGICWPDTNHQANAVTIRFDAGYGVAAAVPDDIKTAMRLLMGHWYENREDVVTGAVPMKLQRSVDALLWMNRVPLIK